MARSGFSSSWMLHLPMVLLGLRSDIREDGLMSSAELVYGAALRLPGELLPDPAPSAPTPQADFLKDLQVSLRTALPLPVVHHGRQSAHVPPSLEAARFVYVRIDAVRPPLVRPYEGPYRVVAMDSKTCRLLKNGRPWIVSLDRLKPAVTPSRLTAPGRGRTVLDPSARPFLPASSPVASFPRSPDLDASDPLDDLDHVEHPVDQVDLDPDVLVDVAPPARDVHDVHPHQAQDVQAADVRPAYTTCSGRSSRPPDRYGF